MAPLVTAEQGSQAANAALGPISQDKSEHGITRPEVKKSISVHARLKQGGLVRRQPAGKKLHTLAAAARLCLRY